MSPFPVFVINLKRDTERLDFMKRQLDKINIPFEVIPAVDGDSISRRQMEKIYGPEPAARKGDSLCFQEIGCWMSHIKAWRIMLERDLPAALILEDDVLLDEDFPKILRNLRLPEECQILQLVSGNTLCSARYRVFSSYGAVSLPNGWKMACHLGDSYGTLAYIIRPALARRLLQKEGLLRRSIDVVLFCRQCNFHLPWIVYKKEKGGAYTTLGEEKRFLGPRTIAHAIRRHRIETRIKNIRTGIPHAVADAAGDKNLPVFLINLKKDARRLEAARRKFDAMGLSFETVEAVDGDLIPAETMNKIYDGKRARRKIKRELSPVEISRYLSHAKAWRALLNTDAPAAAIVEDSAVLDDDFPKFIQYSGDPNQSSGDQTKRGVCRRKHIFAPPFPVPLPHERRRLDDEEIKAVYADTAGRRFQTSAYIIHRSRARRLLRTGRRIQRPVDDLLFHKKQGLKQRFLEQSKKYFWDAVALFNTHVLCRIFPPAQTKVSILEGDDPLPAGARITFKIMFSCYSFSRPFGLNLNKGKTGKPAHE